MRGSIRISVLGGLLLANLALTWLVWRQLGPEVLRFSAFTVPVCQAGLLAVWLGLGAGKLPWRLLVAVLLTLVIGQAMTLGASGQRFSSRSGTPELTTFLGLGLIELLLVVYALLLPLRQLRGWRLTWDSSAEAAPTARFQIADVMIWMIPLSVALALPRGLAALGLSPMMELAVGTLIIGSILAPVVWPALVISFTTQRRNRKLACLAFWTLLYGSLPAATSVYQLYRQLQALSPGFVVPWWRWLFEFAAPLLAFVAAAVLTVVNCLVLRALGTRLVRPTTKPTTPPPTTD